MLALGLNLIVAPQAYQGSPAGSGSAPVPKEAQCRPTSRRWRYRTERSGVGGAEEVWIVGGVTNAASIGESGCGRECYLEREELAQSSWEGSSSPPPDVGRTGAPRRAEPSPRVVPRLHYPAGYRQVHLVFTCSILPPKGRTCSGMGVASLGPGFPLASALGLQPAKFEFWCIIDLEIYIYPS